MEKNDFDKRVLTLKKILNAPIDLVWEAWTSPEHIAQWWGPKGMEVKVVQHNFTVGGYWKYVMAMPNGGEFISEGVYKEIIVNERIVTSADFIPMTAGVEMYILFEEHDGKTHLTFSIVHPTEEYKLQQEKMGFYNGWGSAFERLEQFLSKK